MLETIKSSSLLTKLLYIFTLLLFIVWVIPKISAYYSNVNSYERNLKELKEISSKHGLSTQTEKFSESSFQKNTELLFSKVDIKSLGEERYEVNINMKKEDLKSFHTFIETLSLRYYVKIQNTLEFTTGEETINVKMVLKAF